MTKQIIISSYSAEFLAKMLFILDIYSNENKKFYKFSSARVSYNALISCVVLLLSIFFFIFYISF